MQSKAKVKQARRENIWCGGRYKEQSGWGRQDWQSSHKNPENKNLDL